MAATLPWFDAHLDLATLAVHRRDMLASPETCGGPWPPAAVTLPSLRDGGVCMALGTIFTEAGGTGPESFPHGDVERAYAAGRAQLEVYLTWRDQGHATLDLRRLLYVDPGVGEIRGGMGVAELVRPGPTSLARKALASKKLHLGILIEGADPVRSPDELGWWADRGVVAVGLAWRHASRYAGGNSVESGLTEIGRAMIEAIDRHGLVHDVSHLSDRSLEGLLERARGPVMASHSNCRALLPPLAGGKPDQRHLTDEAIREIARRRGVIGLNLFSKFLEGGMKRASIDRTIAHVERICEIAGRRDVVGLGSDMDGGLSAADLPQGIDRPADLGVLTDALSARGWSDDEVNGFAHANWITFFRRAFNRRRDDSLAE